MILSEKKYEKSSFTIHGMHSHLPYLMLDRQ